MNIQNEGWTIVKNALSSEEVEQARSHFWDWLESLGSGINRNDLDTWSDDNWPGDVTPGFISSHGISQSKFAWYVRSRPKVREAFSRIWNTDELLCSMDSVICWRPWWLCDSEDWKPTVEGLHIDQNLNVKKGFWCVQGMVVLYDVTPITGGLQVVPRTHRPDTQEVLEKYCPPIGDFCLLPKVAQQLRLDSRSESIPEDEIKEIVKNKQLVEAKAGDLILWDSRLIHGGKVGIGLPDVVYSDDDNDDNDNDNDDNEDNEVNNKVKPTRLGYTPELTRLAVPVCMMPRFGVKSNILRNRVIVFEKRLTMNHWANEINITPDYDSHGTNISKEPPIYCLTKDEAKYKKFIK